MSLPIGRPRKISTKVQQEIIHALQVGSTYEMACRYAGVKYDTFLKWMARGRMEAERLDKAHESLRDTELVWHEVPRKKKPGRKKKGAAERPATRWIPDKFPAEVIQSLRPLPRERAFLQFFHAIEQANGVAEVSWLEIIDTVAQQDAQWAAWMLAHRIPQTYGNKQQVEHSTPPEQPLQIEQQISGEIKVEAPQFDQLASILRVLEEVGAFESGAVGSVGTGTDSQADEVHPDSAEH